VPKNQLDTFCNFATIPACQCVTDGQSDRQASARSSAGENNALINC